MNETFAVASNNKLVGQLGVKFWLENKGPIKQQVIIPPAEKPTHDPKTEYEAQLRSEMETQKQNLQKMQFKTALDLELWKTEQEEQFMQQLKQKERELLSKYVSLHYINKY